MSKHDATPPLSRMFLVILIVGCLIAIGVVAFSGHKVPDAVSSDTPTPGNNAPHEPSPGREDDHFEANVQSDGAGRPESIPRPMTEASLAVPTTVAPLPRPQTVFPPEVVLSHEHATTCLVRVGDRMPELKLADTVGTIRSLTDLLGQRMTVVVFWNTKVALAYEQYERLEGEVAQPYANLELNVVAVNVGDPVEQVAALHSELGHSFPCLLDTDGQAMSQIATRAPPRTFLLDAAGRIVWFDIEYSRGSTYELNNAVYYHTLESHSQDDMGPRVSPSMASVPSRRRATNDWLTLRHPAVSRPQTLFLPASPGWHLRLY